MSNSIVKSIFLDPTSNTTQPIHFFYGKNYNDITIIEDAGFYYGKNRKGLTVIRAKRIKFMCNCGKIGYADIKRVLKYKVRSCGCHLSQIKSKRLLDKPLVPRLAHGESSKRRVFSLYRLKAEQRNIDFDINLEDFSDVVKRNCFYCGAKPGNKSTKFEPTGSFIYSGLDRINNNLGYSIANCVSCCITCNIAKGVSTVHEFKAWVTKVHDKIILESNKGRDIGLAKSDVETISDLTGNTTNTSAIPLAVSVFYKIYRAHAKNRKINFELSTSDFEKTVSGSCYLCGVAPSVRTIKYNKKFTLECNGIDRINSSDGYSIENVAPCCTKCNRAKNDCSLHFFKEWICQLSNRIREGKI